MAVYKRGAQERCPRCLTVVRFEFANQDLGLKLDNDENLVVVFARCPQCNHVIITVEFGKFVPKDDGKAFVAENEFVVWPRQTTRPVPPEVPSHIASDYTEAVEVLNISPKASAALSRRCLQAVLREAGNANQHNLVDQIKAVTPTLPSYIAENVDAIRNIGNFAAHPGKDKASGEIIDVEPGEAEWNLDVLDMLFDFYYVQPTLAKKKRDALNAKLKAAGKRPMK
jgi:phage FluMu protein Com